MAVITSDLPRATSPEAVLIVWRWCGSMRRKSGGGVFGELLSEYGSTW